MYPHGMPNIPNGGGTSPRISPSPLAGLLMAPLSVSSRGGSRPLNRWGQAAQTFHLPFTIPFTSLHSPVHSALAGLVARPAVTSRSEMVLSALLQAAIRTAASILSPDAAPILLV